MPMDPQLAELLRKMEAGQIHRQELQEYQQQGLPEDLDLELLWMLFAFDTLEQHRLRLVQKLRARWG
jgi:hypothetical protein